MGEAHQCFSYRPNKSRVPHIPDFLRSLVDPARLMRLSLKKGAHAVVSRPACRKFGVSRSFFARCGIPRTQTSNPGSLNNSGRGNPTHRLPLQNTLTHNPLMSTRTINPLRPLH